MPGHRFVARAFLVGDEQDGERLDAVVRLALDGATPRALSHADVRRVIVGGGVEIAGRVVRGAGRPLRAGQRVSVRVDVTRLASQRGVCTAQTPAALPVVYEDAHLLVVNKPAGLPTVPTADARRPSLVDLANTWLARRDAAGAAVAPLGVHQRLDATTSGLVLFSKTSAAASGLATAFSSRTVEKTYLALCASRTDRIVGHVAVALDVSGRGKRARVAPAEDGVAASTRVRVLERFGAVALVEARPETGRKHQVRAHLATAGWPLLGDARYGGPMRWQGAEVPRPMLHAWRLRLPHPVTGDPLSLEVPPPDDFRRALNGLRAGPLGSR